MIKKKILPILLGLILAFAMMPMMASAEDTGTGHVAGQDGWSEWTSATSLPTGGGKYILTNDVTINSTWSVPTGETTVCLNGKKIQLELEEGQSGSVISIDSGRKLTICDHSSDGNGRITGGNARDGGGVYNLGTFTMEGGNISGNTAKRGGGGVCNNEGTFTMEEGSISGNTGAYGGGVYNLGGNFTMEKGSITNNSGVDGGGVLTEYGTFTMKGGSISDNSGNGKFGGGVQNENGTFTMEGGNISGNTATTFGGGVYNFGTFTMEGGNITSNNSGDDGGGVDNHSTFTMEGGNITGNTTAHGGGVYNDSTFTMEGGNISGNTATTYGGGVDNSGTGTFTMEGGSISDNTANSGAGGVSNFSTFTMEEGSISGNKADSGAGGVVNNGTFTMKGGSIKGNTGNHGGGVDNDMTFNIGSGENEESSDIIISGNKAEGNTSNVHVISGKTINVTGKVSAASKIGVTTTDKPDDQNTVVFTSSLKGNGSISNFFSDEGYAVTETEKGEAQLIAHIHDWTIQKTATGDACEIKCHAEGCPYSTCTVTAEDRYYTGKPYAGATSATDPAFPPALSITWKYEGTSDTAYDLSEKAPTNAGAYTATATIKVEVDPTKKETISSNFNINKAPLTITANNQTYVYNGKTQGPGDALYGDAAEIAKVVTVKGLKGSDKLTSIVVDGQRKEIGTSPLVPSNAAIGIEGKATANYDITYVNGTLKITPIPLKVTIKGSSSTKNYNGKEQTYKGTVTATSSDKAFDPSKFSYTGSSVAKGTKVGDYTTALSKNKCVYKDKHYKVNWTIGNPVKLTIKAVPNPKPEPKPDKKVKGPLITKMTAKGKKSLALSWSKVDGAEGYDIFFTRCNHGKKHPKCKKIKTIKVKNSANSNVSANNAGTIKWTKKHLKGKKAYKAYVKAWAMKDGQKTYIKTSPAVHAYTSGYTKKRTNAKNVIVKKTNVSLTVGTTSNNTYKIKAKVKKLKKGKRLMSKKHAPKLRYISSNKKIATVSKKGKITAQSKGKCKIFVFAVNGVGKTVNVTVR